LSSRLPGVIAAGAWDGSWGGHHLDSSCLIAKTSHVGVDVDGSAYHLHWPTNCDKQTKAHILLTGVVPSHRVVKVGVALGYLPRGVKPLRVDALPCHRPALLGC
jgi:hypothetical protein